MGYNMKSFFKENLITVLLVILIGLVFLGLGRVMIANFTRDAKLCRLETTKQRVQAIEHFGWEVDETSETHENVYIPAEFDDVYTRYNAIQKLSGFDLKKYQGKGVIRYTYLVTNFPDEIKDEVFVNILVYNGCIIGGDCMTVALDGFMLPIDRRHID